MILLKQHLSEHTVLICLCDSDLIGKEIDGKKLSEYFYKGNNLSEEEILKLIQPDTTLNIIGKESIEFSLKHNLIKQEILAKSQEFLGVLGMSKAGAQILKYNNGSQRGIIRVNHNHVDELRSALAFINQIDNKNAIIKSVGVSGILKKAEEKYLIKGGK